MSILWWLAAGFMVLAVALLVAALNALLQRRVLKTGFRLLLAGTLAALAAAFGAIGIGMQGYRALTHEEIATTVRIEPVRGVKQFRAQLQFADGRATTFLLAGDEFYIDARVLKWHPLANVFGLHTAYELDRVSGRYRDIADEKSLPRTVFALGQERPVDLFGLRQRYTLLAPLLDAEYGSGTFSAATEPVTYEVRVSTSGLLIRPVAK